VADGPGWEVSVAVGTSGVGEAVGGRRVAVGSGAPVGLAASGDVGLGEVTPGTGAGEQAARRSTARMTALRRMLCAKNMNDVSPS